LAFVTRLTVQPNMGKRPRSAGGGKGKGKGTSEKDTSEQAGSQAKRRKGKELKLGQEDAGDDFAPVRQGVDEDLALAREAVHEAASAAADDSAKSAAAEADSVGDAEAEKSDPYLMADAAYIKKDTRWRNKQRTLCFTTRGVTSQFRHLCEDVRQLLPHHKTEPKFEKSAKLQDINEVCELKSCNNCVFFEARKKQDLYMYVARVPTGPTMKFQVLNIHTTGEVRLAGNCLMGSRPLLQFDKHFSEISFLKLIRTMFIQAFGTPRNHPKSKPFHDHVMCFHWMDHKIWFRHYQISPETPADADLPEKQQLTEIGPRFVLDPIRIMAGSFGGPTLYANAFYMSPTALRVQAKKLLGNPYRMRKEKEADRAERMKLTNLPEDPLDEVFK